MAIGIGNTNTFFRAGNVDLSSLSSLVDARCELALELKQVEKTVQVMASRKNDSAMGKAENYVGQVLQVCADPNAVVAIAHDVTSSQTAPAA